MKFRNSRNNHSVVAAVAICVLVFICTDLNAAIHSIVVSINGISPVALTVNSGDTVKWMNHSESNITVQCGYGHPGTQMPEGNEPFMLSIYPNSEKSTKFRSAGTYVYSVSVSGNLLFGEILVIAPLPVELTDFVATTIKNEVILDWSTGGEINNERFEIQRVRVENAIEMNSSLTFLTIASLQGMGNSGSVHNYRFIDKNLESGTYRYRLKQFDYNGNFVYHMLADDVEIGVPGKFRVSQNYPNPFNPETSVGIDIPFEGHLSAGLYDASGKLVMTLVNGAVIPGYSILRIDGSSLSSGYYFCRFYFAGRFGTESVTKLMMLLK